MTQRRVPGVTPPSRTNRNERRRRSRRIEAIVTAAVVVLAGFYAWTRTSADPSATPTPPGPGVSASPSRPADLAVLSITGGSGPMILIVGTAGSPVAISLPERLLQVVPGMGETTLDTLGQLNGPTVRVGVSNTLGVWVRHYGVASVQSMAKAVASAGGLPVDLGRAFKANGTVVGPGKVTLTGLQVIAYLTGPKAEVASRWRVFTTALLRQHLSLSSASLVDTDDAAAVSRLLASARGATPTVLPVTDVGGLVQAPDFKAIDVLARTLLGSTVTPTPVIVQNGNGVPGVGAIVAKRLIPVGFRVVISTNAQSFDVLRTSVLGLGVDTARAAGRARRALGVGKVTVSSVPSGVADVKIIVGKDFK